MKTLKKIIFWLLSFTWGLPVTLVGALVAIVLLITGHKPHRFYQNVYFCFGKGGWGFEAGPFFFLSTDAADSLYMKQHESGHGLQNIMFGPLMPFLVSIPSCIRFWYREWLVNSGRKKYNGFQNMTAPGLREWPQNWAKNITRRIGEYGDI